MKLHHYKKKLISAIFFHAVLFFFYLYFPSSWSGPIQKTSLSQKTSFTVSRCCPSEPIVNEHELASFPESLFTVFEVLEKLGEGGEGSSFLCQASQNDESFSIEKEKYYAVKCMIGTDNDHNEAEERATELFSSGALNHPSLVKIFSDTYTTCNTYRVVVQEWMPHSIVEFSPLSESQLRQFLAQILEVEVFLRRKDITHRDIKTDNVCIDKEGNVVLIDLDCAKMHASKGFEYIKDDLFKSCTDDEFPSLEIITEDNTFSGDQMTESVIKSAGYTFDSERDPFIRENQAIAITTLELAIGQQAIENAEDFKRTQNPSEFISEALQPALVSHEEILIKIRELLQLSTLDDDFQGVLSNLLAEMLCSQAGNESQLQIWLTQLGHDTPQRARR